MEAKRIETIGVVSGDEAEAINRGVSIVYTDILARVQGELRNQDALWGVRNLPAGDWMLILTEEIGEMAEEILKRNQRGVIDEVVQCVAVLVRIAEKATRP